MHDSKNADTKSTAPSESRTSRSRSANESLPVDTIKRKDTRKGNRHRPGYMTEYMREYRARKRKAKLSTSSQAKPK